MNTSQFMGAFSSCHGFLDVQTGNRAPPFLPKCPHVCIFQPSSTPGPCEAANKLIVKLYKLNSSLTWHINMTSQTLFLVVYMLSKPLI